LPRLWLHTGLQDGPSPELLLLRYGQQWLLLPLQMLAQQIRYQLRCTVANTLQVLPASCFTTPGTLLRLSHHCQQQLQALALRLLCCVIQAVHLLAQPVLDVVHLQCTHQVNIRLTNLRMLLLLVLLVLLGLVLLLGLLGLPAKLLLLINMSTLLLLLLLLLVLLVLILLLVLPVKLLLLINMSTLLLLLLLLLLLVLLVLVLLLLLLPCRLLRPCMLLLLLHATTSLTTRRTTLTLTSSSKVQSTRGSSSSIRPDRVGSRKNMVHDSCVNTIRVVP